MPDDIDGVEITARINLHALGTRYTHDGEPSAEPMKVIDAIVQEAARQVVDRTIDYDFKREIQKAVNRNLDTEIFARLQPLLDKAFNRQFQQTNEFGEPIGDNKTLSEIIAAKADKELKLNSRERGVGYGATESMLTKLIRDEVEHRLRTELTAVVAEAKKEVIAAVQAEGGKVLAETIARMAGVPR